MHVLVTPPFLITYAVIQTFVFLLLIRLADPYQHEPLGSLALMMLWGAVGATALSAFGNQAVNRMLPDRVATVFGSAIAAPAVEEIAKGIALILAFVVAGWLHRRFGLARITGVSDGLVYGAAIGLGFAFTEDIAYLLADVAAKGIDNGFTLFLARRDFLGVSMLEHAVFTGVLGAGIGLASISRRWTGKIGFALFGLLAAMSLHALNNGLVQLMLVVRFGFDSVAQATAAGSLPAGMASLADSVSRLGVIINDLTFVGLGVALVLWLRYQRKTIRLQLNEEVAGGLVDRRDADLVPRYFHRLGWYWQLTRVGEIERARVARRLHIELARLAFDKQRANRIRGGDDDVLAARQRVANLRAERSVDVYVGG